MSSHVTYAVSRGRVQSLALVLLYPARMLAHLTEPAPAPGSHPAALYVSEQPASDGST
jgi:hypothetical protein